MAHQIVKRTGIFPQVYSLLKPSDPEPSFRLASIMASKRVGQLQAAHSALVRRSFSCQAFGGIHAGRAAGADGSVRGTATSWRGSWRREDRFLPLLLALLLAKITATVRHNMF